MDEIEQAIGRELDDEEADALLGELQRRARAKRAEGATDDFSATLAETAEAYARDMAESAIIEKRNAALNLKLRLKAGDFVRRQFGDDVVLGLEAINVGVNRPRPGARLSAAAEQKQLAKTYLSGLVADLSRKDLWKVFTSGTMDREIAQAMWAHNREVPLPTDHLPREAVEIAGVLSKWQEVARLDANKAGAWIKRMPGYIVRRATISIVFVAPATRLGARRSRSGSIGSASRRSIRLRQIARPSCGRRMMGSSLACT